MSEAVWCQKQIKLRPQGRGFHLITQEILNSLEEIRRIDTGILHLFIQHTSASLCINENADPDVRGDMERHFMKFVPENAPYYQHTLEGADDMPAHIKSVTIGCELSIPITKGALALGVWQGIYLGEHRVRAGGRVVIATMQGINTA